MSPDEASEKIVASVTVTREDIARAKAFALQAKESGTNALAEQWLNAQNCSAPREVQLESAEAGDVLALIARSYSLRMALYQAVWELINAGELIPAGTASEWQANVSWRTPRGGGGLALGRINFPYPPKTYRPPLAAKPPLDVDVFLQGIDSASLHSGIREAVDQALGCFRRGLYLPAIAMMTAGAEATWSECGTAVAKKLANQKLQGIMNDQYASLSRKVAELRKVLESAAGKPILKAASLSPPRVADAELWTTTLRDRRNALHWGKAKSFIAQHSDAASLLLGAPIHLGTVEAIRKSCQSAVGA
jgi:hypothetical protein